MNCPKRDVLPLHSREQNRQGPWKMISNDRRYLSREVHFETGSADPPSDIIRRIRQNGRAKIDHLEPGRLAAYDGSGATIGKQQERENLLKLAAFLEMQRAQLDRDDENPGLSIGADDVAGEPQRRNGSRAPHKTDNSPLNRRRQAQTLEDLQVNA